MPKNKRTESKHHKPDDEPPAACESVTSVVADKGDGSGAGKKGSRGKPRKYASVPDLPVARKGVAKDSQSSSAGVDREPGGGQSASSARSSRSLRSVLVARPPCDPNSWHHYMKKKSKKRVTFNDDIQIFSFTPSPGENLQYW